MTLWNRTVVLVLAVSFPQALVGSLAGPQNDQDLLCLSCPL